jgi:muramoyltetrapeptide carboxypeptidase LdcA involved in peptidoglycan recycling
MSNRPLAKPPALRPGGTIAVIAPSWCGPVTYPHRIERGAAYLESRGYRVVLGDHLFGQRGQLSGTAEERAADLHAFLEDTRVQAIVGAIGGDHSCHMLPLLDIELIGRNPKILVGFSDVTVLNLAIHAMTGLVTFNGPALMTDFAEFPSPFAYTMDSFFGTVTRAAPAGRLASAREWTEDTTLRSWQGKLDLTGPRPMTPSAGWSWLKPGRGEGPLIGGCLESMQHLRGTPYWPPMDGAIWFFETSGGAPKPGWVDAVLQDYDNMGVLARLQGIVVGRPARYSDVQRTELRAVLLERTRAYDFPILADVDFGHTAPQLTLPIGCRAVLDTAERRFEVLEAAVTPA